MVYGREVTVSVVPTVKPLMPYSTIHEVQVPFSVQVTMSRLVSRPARAILDTGGQAGMVSTKMSSTK